MLCEATLKGYYSTGGTADMVWAFETDEDITTGILEDFLNDLAEWIVDYLFAVVIDVMMDNISFASVELRQITDVVTGSKAFLGEQALTLVGTSTGDALPEQIAGYVYLPRVGGGRGGAKFLPGFGEAQNTDGNVGGGVLAGIAAFAVVQISNWFATQTGIFVQPLVYSETEGQTFAYSGSAEVKTIYSNQVRRRRDIGV